MKKFFVAVMMLMMTAACACAEEVPKNVDEREQPRLTARPGVC